ncbi:Ketosamine-3-kinase [Colletotrichum viniferum]|nr:Ketosamine-3-kinase [Colletotrichum viniferum]
MTSLETNILPEKIAFLTLNDVHSVTSMTQLSQSEWATTFCLTIRHRDKSEEQYFVKVSYGAQGKEALEDEFAATSAIHYRAPNFCSRPIACGTYESDTNSHFYICEFHNLSGRLPAPGSFCKELAQLHSRRSPRGDFGFQCVTYNGDNPQDNTWSNNWEHFFPKSLRHLLNVREDRAGPSAELEQPLPELFGRVIPRLLRPLETAGRALKPSLVHGDLWYGNTSIDEDTGKGIVYDPASFWAHNEYELGSWRPKRNRFTQEYFDAYHSLIEKSDPIGDHDDRNALYAMYVVQAVHRWLLTDLGVQKIQLTSGYTFSW